MPHSTLLTIVALAALAASAAPPAPGDEPRIRAPEFAGADSWLNTDHPLTLKELRGQVVLLDFWTYCCINCMHIFPDLAHLEHKYAKDPFVVIGVHSGKFSQEKDAANIRQAILRHNIAHPVAVDSRYKIWNAYAVRAWPTLVLIDPEGYVVASYSGEGHRDEIDADIAKLLEKHRANGTLAKSTLTFRRERAAVQSGALEFPGKVLADAAGGRLFISDTNHNRILIASLDGKVNQVVGSGQPGLKDGPPAEAQFRQPQGLCLSEDGQSLYVADTENHALRQIDLKSGAVKTLAGTGAQSAGPIAAGPALQTPLSSPWDLVRIGPRLAIAMAGSHQLAALDLDQRDISVLAGSGREAAADGPAQQAAFAQPSGLATDGRSIYVADSESSSVRAVDASTGATRTLAGSGDLFGFGRRDGKGAAARFQHPLGVALAEGSLYVADTFNELIRRIDLKSGQVSTFAGTGRTDVGDEKAIGFFEPGGISVAGDELYIADTNHHRIIRLDLRSRRAAVLAITLP